MYRKRRGNYFESQLGDEAGILNSYLNQIKKYPLLKEREQRENFKLLKQGNLKIKDEIFNSNLRLVIHIAKNYFARYPNQVMDIIQEGNLGLMRSIESFDLSKKTKFSTYAYFWIEQKIRRYLEDNGELIALSHDLIFKIKRLEKEKTNFFKSTGKEDSLEHLASAFNEKKEIIRNTLEKRIEIFSLDSPINEFEEDSSLMLEGLKDKGSESPEDKMYKEKIKKLMLKKISSLPHKYQEIVLLRFGLKDEYERTLREIGEIFDLTRERVRQIVDKSLELIKEDKIFMDELKREHYQQDFK
jgi:RNA polymerase primary sigma factor